MGSQVFWIWRFLNLDLVLGGSLSRLRRILGLAWPAFRLSGRAGDPPPLRLQPLVARLLFQLSLPFPLGERSQPLRGLGSDPRPGRARSSLPRLYGRCIVRHLLESGSSPQPLRNPLYIVAGCPPPHRAGHFLEGSPWMPRPLSSSYSPRTP